MLSNKMKAKTLDSHMGAKNIKQVYLFLTDTSANDNTGQVLIIDRGELMQ